jgi:tetratricopeptide (TPR) repeat protein
MSKSITIGCLFLLSFAVKAQDTLTISKQLISEHKLNEAVVLLDEYNNHHTDSTALILTGDTYYLLNFYEVAANRYTELLLLHPTHFYTLKKRAMSYYMASLFKQAHTEWTKVCRLQPDDKYNWYFLALINQQLGDDKGAIKSWSGVIKQDTFFVDALTARSILYLKTRQYRLALSDIDSAIKISQFNELLFSHRALALLGLKRYKEAEMMYERLLKYNEKNYHAWFGLGNVYFGATHYAKAIDAYDVCLAINPNFEIGYFKRALTQLELNQEQKACPDLLKAHELGYPDALFYLKKYCGVN